MAGFADSIIYTLTTSPMSGILLFDPTVDEPVGLEYLYGNTSRSEGLTVRSAAHHFLTHVSPVYDFAAQSSRVVGLAITVPFGPTHDAEVQALRQVVRNRRIMIYRDNRGRFIPGIMRTLSISDVPHGSVVTTTFAATAYQGVTA